MIKHNVYKCSWGHCPNNIIKQFHHKILIEITNYIIPAQLKCEISIIIQSIKISDMTCQAYMLKSSSHFTPHRHQYFIEHLQYVADVIFLGNQGLQSGRAGFVFNLCKTDVLLTILISAKYSTHRAQCVDFNLSTMYIY